MAKKRFTDIEIWDKEWYMELTPKHKCLMKYIFDKCDAAGCWKPNWKLASLHINDTVNFTDLLFLPKEQYEILENGKIFIPDFINFQYGTLSEKSPAHNPIFLAIEKNNLSNRVFNRVQSNPKEKEKEKEKEEEEEKDMEKPKFWFLKFYHSTYENYKNIFNGQSTTEDYFTQWKTFINFIYEKKYEEIFECKFLSPHDFASLVKNENFIEENWEIPIKKILATGIKPEHNLFYRIPEFIKYSKKDNGTDKKPIGIIAKELGAHQLLNSLKQGFTK